MTLRQKEGSTGPIDFALTTQANSVFIPDLNTVIIADGPSENGEYYYRIIEVKEKTQGI